MGNSLNSNHCVLLSDLPKDDYDALTGDTYTVVRTDGRVQEGWRIPTEVHECVALARATFLPACHATSRVKEGGFADPNMTVRHMWRMHMTFDKEGEHACGWRHLGLGADFTFWPTRLSGDVNEGKRTEWLTSLLNKLNTLKSPDEIQAAQEAAVKAEAAALNTEAAGAADLEAIYQADEPARHAAGKALLTSPVATPAMMAEMRTRESTGSRCLRNNIIPVEAGENFTANLLEMEKTSVYDANRIRRLFDCGCPKSIVYWLTSFVNHTEFRNQFITEEEAKLFLEPMAEQAPLWN
jgi:hypothetical protein